jgi:hypothetical protein
MCNSDGSRHTQRGVHTVAGLGVFTSVPVAVREYMRDFGSFQLGIARRMLNTDEWHLRITYLHS